MPLRPGVRPGSAAGWFPVNELLWRDGLRAEHLAGNREAQHRLADQLLALADELDTDLEPETERLLAELDTAPSLPARPPDQPIRRAARAPSPPDTRSTAAMAGSAGCRCSARARSCDVLNCDLDARQGLRGGHARPATRYMEGNASARETNSPSVSG